MRKSLLANAGISVGTIPADIDERAIQDSSGLKNPGEIAALLRWEKAKFISLKHPGRACGRCGPDTGAEPRLFSKPQNRAAASAQIATLSGQTHELHSAVSVTKDGAPLFSHVSVARHDDAVSNRTRDRRLYSKKLAMP